MTPEPGDQVRVEFAGVAEKVYPVAGQADGELLDMMRVRLASGHLIFIALVDGVDVTPEAAGP